MIWPWRRRRREAELDEEIQGHLAMARADHEAAGESPTEAGYAARREFGNATLVKEVTRSMWRGSWLEDVGQDLRFAWRQMRRAPGYSAIAVVTLALGIGATTTIYCAVHDLLLKPLPYRDAERLVTLDEEAYHGRVWLSPTRGIVNAWRAGNRSLEGLVTWSGGEWTLSDEGGGAPELADGAALEPGVLPFLGVAPALGRAFTAEDALPGSAPVALIADGLWRRRFGASRAVLGRQINLDGRSVTVIGVLPRGFGVALFLGLLPNEVFVPLIPGSTSERVGALGRLRRGVTPEQAARDLSGISVSDGSMQVSGAHVVPEDADFRTWFRSILVLLSCAVALVLLIACANVANLLLARALSRQREFGVRTAIGAGRGRLIRQLLTESVLLGVVGGALGALLAWGAIPLVAALRPPTPTMAALRDVRLDPSVLAVTLLIAVGTGLLFGLAPAFLATGRSVGEALKDAARATSAGAVARRVRGALVAAETAISTVLLIAAGLLLRSLVAQARSDESLYPPGLLAVQVSLSADRVPLPAVRAERLAEIVERVRGAPGAQAVSASLMPPWEGGVILDEVSVEGRTGSAGATRAMIGFNRVAPDFFNTVEIPLLAGRVFSGDTSQHEAIVGRAFAREYLGPGNGLGARIRFGKNGPWMTVMGVVADPRLPGEAHAPPRPTVYEPFASMVAGRGGTTETIVARAANPAALLPFVTRAAFQVDPGIHVLSARTMRSALAAKRAEPRFVMTLLLTFAVLALGLAAVGLYGVVAFSVRQRTHEIGVRAALGAGGRDVLRLVMRQSVGVALVGIVVGVGGGLAATRLIRNRLYLIGPGDPATFVAVGALLVIVALVASYLPARAALRVDPVEALRAE